jgi:transposase
MRIRQLRLTIAKLEEQLRRNSRNSSQPPSQAKAEQKPIQDEVVRPVRRRGGQPGHVGHGRTLVPVEAVDQLVVHRPVACQTCGAWGTIARRSGIKSPNCPG